MRDQFIPWSSILLAFAAGIVVSIFFTPLVGLIAAPLGLFLAELNRLKNREDAVKSTKAYMIGWGWAFGARFMIGLTMIGTWMLWGLDLDTKRTSRLRSPLFFRKSFQFLDHASRHRLGLFPVKDAHQRLLQKRTHNGHHLVRRKGVCELQGFADRPVEIFILPNHPMPGGGWADTRRRASIRT
jgi:hypothetical protein